MIKSRAREIRDEVQALAALGRELNPAEEARLDGMKSELSSLSKQHDEIRSADATNAAIRQFGSSLFGPPTGAVKAGQSPRVKAAGGSSWGDAVVRANSDVHGFKALTVAGTVPVSVPLAAEPVTKEAPVLLLRQLIPTGPDTVGRWSYLRQTVRTNNAAVVAPGALKPTSVYTLGRVDNRARTIAHLSEPIPRQDLMDAPLLEQFVNEEMRLGLELALEAEIVSGDGTGEHFDGIANVSGTQAQAWTTDHVITLRHAINKLETIGLNATGVLLNPADWLTVELAFATDYTGAPGVVAPVDRVARRVWGVPVAVSTAVPAGVGYVADFASSTQLHIREDAVLDWSENVYDPNALGAGVGATDWQRNMLRFRCEGRFGFDVLRPLGIVEIDLTA